jgi:hypothetical protein
MAIQKQICLKDKKINEFPEMRILLLILHSKLIIIFQAFNIQTFNPNHSTFMILLNESNFITSHIFLSLVQINQNSKYSRIQVNNQAIVLESLFSIGKTFLSNKEDF